MPDVRPPSPTEERRYTPSIGEKERDHAFNIEDARWTRGKQLRDWLKLALLIAIVLAYHLLIFFFEPGLR